MAIADEITKAISAHGAWKRRLADAIASGKCEVTPERANPDNLCDFGKWLYSLPPAQRTSKEWASIQSLHAAFHKEAAAVLRLALAGQKAQAEKAMAGEYSSVSAKLTAAMMSWKQAA